MIRDPNDRPSAEELLNDPYLSDAEMYRADFAKVVKDFLLLKKADKVL